MDSTLDSKALWDISYGLYVVTSISAGKMNGQIANTVFQVSANPPKVAVSINKENLTHTYIKTSKVLAISTLEEDTPMPFIGLFGFKSGRDIDKLSQTTYNTGITGCPCVTENTLSIMEGKVIGSADAGTHSVFIVELLGAEVLKKGKPLTYAYYQEVKKGKASKNAPTYKGDTMEPLPEKPKEETKLKKYECGICGYIYDPEKGDSEGNIPAGTPFEKLPDDWTCPVCGASKSEFSPV
jgi:flavin reductase (DIM6/NTAB) family NADH-FMN oxidoreductase RutF/rubredoxin